MDKVDKKQKENEAQAKLISEDLATHLYGSP